MRVKADVFPAIVVVTPPNAVTDPTTLHTNTPKDNPLGARTVDRARVCIIEDQILIAVDSPTGPTLVFKDTVATYCKDSKTREHFVMTTTGKALSFRKDANCGCGSRLRSWAPYGHIMQAGTDYE